MKKSILLLLFISAFFFTTDAQYTELYGFAGGASGNAPMGSLYSDSTFLYGMTSYGGTNNEGVLFKVMSDGTGYSKLHDFTGYASGEGALISDGTFLYGTTLNGGTNGYGYLFKIMPDGTGYLKVLDFTGANGRNPNSSLLYDGTFLYGMTLYGGINDSGVVFKIKPDGTMYSKLLDFDGPAKGRFPPGSLISDGVFLYGMTSSGGTNDGGTIFKIMPDGTGFSKLLDFAGVANGSWPIGTLLFDGTFLYGMTFGGGIDDIGTIFKIMPDGSGYSKLLDFTGDANGQNPIGDLILNGTFLYGMTTYGGAGGGGVLFKIKPDGTSYSKLLDFVSVNAANPFGSLISDSTLLYGMVSVGGANIQGVVFKYDLVTGITEINSAAAFNVYPNPNNGQFTIANAGKQTMTRLEIYNTLGEKIYSTTNNRQQLTYDVDLAHSPKGMYSVKIYEGEKIYSEKILIQ